MRALMLSRFLLVSVYVVVKPGDLQGIIHLHVWSVSGERCPWGYGGEDCGELKLAACRQSTEEWAPVHTGKLPKACECYRQLLAHAQVRLPPFQNHYPESLPGPRAKLTDSRGPRALVIAARTPLSAIRVLHDLHTSRGWGRALTSGCQLRGS